MKKWGWERDLGEMIEALISGKQFKGTPKTQEKLCLHTIKKINVKKKSVIKLSKLQIKTGFYCPLAQLSLIYFTQVPACGKDAEDM